MMDRAIFKTELPVRRKLLLGLVSLAAVAGPIVIGLLKLPENTGSGICTATPEFEVSVGQTRYQRTDQRR